MSTKQRLKASAAVLALVAAGSTHHAAFAQNAPNSAQPLPPAKLPAHSGPVLEQVTVTATRVRTSAQRTPVAINVYSSQQVLQQGVHSVSALQSIDPSLNVSTSSGASYLAVRGVASTDVTEIGDPSVPIARDGFFTNRSYSVNTAFYDIDRVEVLKGPQGTLFGRNSTGGLVSIITNRPTDQFGGYASVEAGSYDTVNSEAAINIPVTPWLQIRASGAELYDEGYRKLDGVNKRGDDQNSQSGRFQAAIEPFEGFKGLVSYEHDNVDNAGDASFDSPLGQVIPLRPTTNYRYYVAPYNKLVDDRVRWEFSYDKLPYDLTLIYSGGYDATTWNHLLDATTPQTVNAPGVEPYPAARGYLQHERPDTWNHEVRITTPQDWRVTLQAGFFHFSENNAVASGLYNYAPLAPLPVPTANYIGQYGIFFNYPTIKDTSNGTFAQAGFKVLPNVNITAGIRYTSDYKERLGTATLNLPALVSPFIPPFGPIVTPGNGLLHENRPTYHAGVDWTALPGTLVYAKYDTGYKSGGFNSNGSSPPVPYGPEVLKTVEVGTKNTLLDRHLQINLDVFHSDYSGYQASQTSAVLQGSGVFNVGSARINGSEAQVNYLVDQIGTFNLNATYLSTQFGHNIIVADGAGAPQQIGAHQLPNAPPWVFDAGFEHTFDFEWGSVTGRIDGKYSSHYYFSVFNQADTRSGSYFLGNLSATYVPPVGNWKVELYVRNFTDAAVLSYAARNYVSYYDTYEYAPPMTMGARLNYKF
jgi:iron complex outermembrane receptor protein